MGDDESCFWFRYEGGREVNEGEVGVRRGKERMRGEGEGKEREDKGKW